jgi:DNA-binding PadR family transcriptional regulator
MTRIRRPSAQTSAVLLALADRPAKWRYGYDLCQQTRLKAGSMYPILMRLADRGYLETAWEQDLPEGRPPRHMYRLTGTGRKLAAELSTAVTRATNANRAAKANSGRLRPRWEGE